MKILQKMKPEDQRWHRVVFLIILSVIFFFGIGHNGYILEPDSYTYMECNFGREPLYPMILLGFRKVFGAEGYLWYVWIFQILVAIISIVYCTCWFARQFRFKKWAVYAVFLLLLLPYWFVTIWYEPYGLWTNHIMTEGLTFSLYHLFYVFVLKTLYGKKVKDYAITCIFALCLASMRSQMLICFAICAALGIAVIIMQLKKKGVMRLLFGCMISILATGGLYIGIKTIYKYRITDNPGDAGTLQLALLANLLYSSDGEDVSCYEDEGFQLLYKELYDRVDELQLNYRYTEGVLANGDRMSASHDLIKYGIINEVYYNYKAGNYSEYVGEMELDEFIKGLEKPLLQKNWWKLIKNSMCEWPKGYMRSIFTATERLYPVNGLFCVFMYLGAVVLSIWNLGRRNWKAAVPMLLVLVVIAMTIAGVALTIFTSMRYLTYNLGLFYVSYLILGMQYRWGRKLLSIDI